MEGTKYLTQLKTIREVEIDKIKLIHLGIKPTLHIFIDHFQHIIGNQTTIYNMDDMII